MFDSLGAFYSVISSTQGGWTWLSSEGRYMGAAAWGDMNRASNPYYSGLRDVLQFGAGGEVRTIRRLAEDPSRPLILTVKNSDGIVEALRQARRTGKRIITLVSDVSPDARDHFVGIDNRAAGQTAAYLIGGMLAGRQATVGVVVGDTAFRCHEDREIGFRTGLRLLLLASTPPECAAIFPGRRGRSPVCVPHPRPCA